MLAGPFYVLCACVGCGMAASYVLPDALLADIIDYDELHTGARSEGLYTVIETNLQQYTEIVGGVLPSLVAYFAGFQAQRPPISLDLPRSHPISPPWPTHSLPAYRASAAAPAAAISSRTAPVLTPPHRPDVGARSGW